MNKFETKLLTGELPQQFYKYKKKYITSAAQMQTDFQVETLEGEMSAKAGDYLCVGPKGELYPCHKEIFEETYEKIEETENGN